MNFRDFSVPVRVGIERVVSVLLKAKCANTRERDDGPVGVVIVGVSLDSERLDCYVPAVNRGFSL